MDHRENGLQFRYRDLTGSRGFFGGSEGQSRAKKFSGKAADHAGSGHGHSDDGTVCIGFCHFQSSTQERENILAAGWHDGNFWQIGIKILHQTQTMDEFFFGWRFVEIMIGNDDFYSMAVSFPDEFFYQLVSGEEFHIDEIQEEKQARQPPGECLLPSVPRQERRSLDGPRRW